MKILKAIILSLVVFTCAANVSAADTTYVSKIADGTYGGGWYIYVPPGTQERYHLRYPVGAWIDIKIAKLSFDKTVGVIWTKDNWQTTNVSYATYEHDLADGYEQWGLNIGEFDGNNAPTIQYCIFAEMNSVTYYDNNNYENYTIHLW